MKKNNNKNPLNRVKLDVWLTAVFLGAGCVWGLTYMVRRDRVRPQVEEYKKSLPDYEETKAKYYKYEEQIEHYRDSLMRVNGKRK